MSGRISAENLHSIIEETRATALVVSPRLNSTAQEALSLLESHDKPTIHTRISYQELLENTGDTISGTICQKHHYLSEKDRNVILLPSSGSTGGPKITYNSHRYLLSYATSHEFRSSEEAEALNICTLPLFHVSIPIQLCP